MVVHPNLVEEITGAGAGMKGDVSSWFSEKEWFQCDRKLKYFSNSHEI